MQRAVDRSNGERLLRLREPPGARSEWRGDYSAQSPQWTARLRHELRWTPALDEEEREYQSLFGLTAGQMCWRRAKMARRCGRAA